MGPRVLQALRRGLREVPDQGSDNTLANRFRGPRESLQARAPLPLQITAATRWRPSERTVRMTTATLTSPASVPMPAPVPPAPVAPPIPAELESVLKRMRVVSHLVV